MTHENPTSAGRLHVIRGCMFVGKTTRLIELLEAARAAGRRTVAVKHACDDRYAPHELATHDGRTLPCATACDLAALRAAAVDCDVIGLDEIHFFDPGVVEVCRDLKTAGRCVIAAAIDNDMWGRPMAIMRRLTAVADEDELLTTPCAVCGRPARFSQRVTPLTGDCMVGGRDDYEPRCSACFVPLRHPPPPGDGTLRASDG